MPYDPDSGLVYREQIVSSKISHPDLGGQVYCRRHPRPNVGISSRGTRSLQDMSLTCLLRHLDVVDSALLRAVPQSIVERIWGAIKKA